MVSPSALRTIPWCRSPERGIKADGDGTETIAVFSGARRIRLASHSPNVRWTCLSRQSRASGGEATSQRLCPKFTTCEGVHPLVGHIGGALAVILGRSSRLAAGLLAGKMAMFFERADWTVRCASESLGIRDIETARRSGERRARRHLWLQRCRTGVPIV